MAIAELRNIPIVDVAEHLGIALSANYKAKCLTAGPDKDKHPSLSLWLPKNRWRCFRCGEGGSTIDLVMKYRNCDCGAACRWLEDEFGRDNADDGNMFFSSTGVLSPGRVTSAVADSSVRVGRDGAEFTKIYDYFVEQLDLREAWVYLRERGLDGVILRANIRCLPSDNRSIRDVMLEKWDSDVLVDSGLFKKSQGTGNLFITFFGYRLIIPYYDAKGRVVWLQGRDIDNGAGHYWNLPGVRPVLYNAKCLADKTFYVCEGAFDVLACRQLRLGSAVGVPGVRVMSLRSVVEMIPPGRRVICASDDDVAGVDFYERLRKEFERCEGVTELSRLDFGVLRERFNVPGDVPIGDLTDVAKYVIDRRFLSLAR